MGSRRAGAPAVFLLSLKAGGQGLNLTRGDYVFHLDPWWNPAVESQASDRSHRIGQKNKVIVTRLLMRHTIEEKMTALKTRKAGLYRALMDGPGSGGGQGDHEGGLRLPAGVGGGAGTFSRLASSSRSARVLTYTIRMLRLAPPRFLAIHENLSGPDVGIFLMLFANDLGV